MPDRNLDAIEQRLGEIDAALERLEQGGYGTCRACGQPIVDSVLVADPAAELCRSCAPGAAEAG